MELRSIASQPVFSIFEECAKRALIINPTMSANYLAGPKIVPAGISLLDFKFSHSAQSAAH
jgi:hypothetical protein